jgi:cytochrome c biogenesis protein CcmG, thiol:disulfide interchange protein DsbE
MCGSLVAARRSVRLFRGACAACLRRSPGVPNDEEGELAMRRVFGILAFVALVGAQAAQARGVKVGDMAPDFDLTLVDGSHVKLSDLRGKVVVLNFWATWCAPCKRELPLLDAVYRIKRQHGLAVYAITTEDSVPVSQLKTLFAALAIPSARRIRGPYAVMEGVPTNYVFDRVGKLRYAKAAAFDLDEMNAIIIPLLREPAS